MFTNILIPVDGSTTALCAVSKSAGLAKTYGSTVTVLYVIDSYPFTGVGADFAYGQAQYLTAATAEANTALDSAKAALMEAGVDKVNTKLADGHAVHEAITRSAEELGADLIVMGSHGRKGLEKLVLGSVTQRVLGATTLPVLVVRE